MAAIVRTADIVVAAAGRPAPAHAGHGQAGRGRRVGRAPPWKGRKLIPDVRADVAEVAGWITPRLGGVGPMTRAMLLRNALRAAEMAAVSCPLGRQ